MSEYKMRGIQPDIPKKAEVLTDAIRMAQELQRLRTENELYRKALMDVLCHGCNYYTVPSTCTQHCMVFSDHLNKIRRRND